jgi:hypothetical protein
VDPERIPISLSPLISQSLVPIEDWIKTVAFLGNRTLVMSEANLLYWMSHSICLACTSLSHLWSLHNEGIFDYWTRCMKSGILAEMEELFAYMKTLLVNRSIE